MQCFIKNYTQKNEAIFCKRQKNSVKLYHFRHWICIWFPLRFNHTRFGYHHRTTSYSQLLVWPLPVRNISLALSLQLSIIIFRVSYFISHTYRGRYRIFSQHNTFSNRFASIWRVIPLNGRQCRTHDGIQKMLEASLIEGNHWIQTTCWTFLFFSLQSFFLRCAVFVVFHSTSKWTSNYSDSMYLIPMRNMFEYIGI